MNAIRPIATGESAFGLKPAFNTKEGWREWRAEWSTFYGDLGVRIRRRKYAIKALQRAGVNAKVQQRALVHDRIVARKMMTLLEEGKARLARLQKMEADIAAQFATFPLGIAECPIIDLHFNKASLEFPQIPKWTLKTKGKTYYIHHITANIPWSTRELDDGPTRGMLRLRKAKLTITKDGEAIIDAA